MSDIIEKYIVVCASIFVFLYSAIFTLNYITSLNNPIIQLEEDKSMISSDGVQKLYESTATGSDILLLLLNTDEMTPYPRAIKINNTPVIKLDNTFFVNKINSVSTIYSSTGQYKLKDMLKHKVTNVEYVYKGEGAPYIHYTLKE